MAKTSKRVLQEQEKQAAQDLATGVAVPPKRHDDGWHDAAQDADARLSRGVRLKFKDGKFYDENGSELPDGATAVALGLRHAWVRWADHRPVEIIERKPGVPLPARETLGYSATRSVGDWPQWGTDRPVGEHQVSLPDRQIGCGLHLHDLQHGRRRRNRAARRCDRLHAARAAGCGTGNRAAIGTDENAIWAPNQTGLSDCRLAWR